MGNAYSFKCKCGYSFGASLGVGFLFPVEYQELWNSARDGKLGKELETFLSEHPEGIINADRVVARCRKCGKYKCVRNLSMYLPIRSTGRTERRWSVAMPFENVECAAPWDLEDSDRYQLYADYQHKCDACDGDMEIISEDRLVKEGIICPECGRPVGRGETILWD